MLRQLLGRFGGEGFDTDLVPLPSLAKAFVFQKVFRFNSKVPWPVNFTSRVNAPHKIDRGNRFPGLSAGCHIDGRNGIRFGENVWIGPKASIISMNHDIADFDQYVETSPVVIESNSWLGAHAIVLPGVHLGPHTVVAAGAVVTKSFPEGDQLLAGVPATIVKALPPYRGSSDAALANHNIAAD